MLSLDEQMPSAFRLPATGGYYNWQDSTMAGITIPGGSDQIVRVALSASRAMLSHVDFVQR